MSEEFKVIFTRLRTMLRRQRGRLVVTEDSPTRYCLAGGVHPVHQTPFPIAWVQIGKAYVSYHHMGVYALPRLLAGCSPRLRARMQGKSCFNFKVCDEALFQELEQLTARGFAVLRAVRRD